MHRLIDAIRQLPGVRHALVYRHYHRESRLIAGKSVAAGDHPSVIHFSVNRSATQYVKSVLQRIAKENDLLPIDFASYAFNSGTPYHTDPAMRDKLPNMFHPRGFLYSALQTPVPGMDNLTDYRAILVVRDPRDVATSAYFSRGWSHPLSMASNVRDKQLELRKQATDGEVDEFVFEHLAKSAQIYRDYLAVIHAGQRMKVLRYEAMTDDFTAWLDDLLAATECSISDRLRAALLNEAAQMQNVKEDKTRHVRQAKPRDHTRKLSAETIARLNEEYADILNGFGYGTDADSTLLPLPEAMRS